MNYTNEPRHDILCIDVRSFFASVEMADRGLNQEETMLVVMSKPNLNGGLVLAASPKVKEVYGFKTGTRRFEIPNHLPIQIVEPRMRLYLQKNQEIIEIFRRFVADDDLHIYSIDESFLDVTHYTHLFGEPKVIARKIQQTVWKELKLSLTIGIGDNPLLAKLALDNQAKHSPQTNYIAYWSYESVPETIWQIGSLTDMWGIGRRTAKKLQFLGIQSVYELAQFDVKRLKKLHGVIGEQLFYHAHGIDQSILSKKYIPLSRSYNKHQILDRDYIVQEEIEIVLQEMSDQVAARLREHHVETQVVRVSIGFSDDIIDQGFSHQLTIPSTSSSKKICEVVLRIFRAHYQGQAVRSVAVHCGKIHYQTNLQFDLFVDAKKTIQEVELEKTIDQVRKKYGYSSLVHASSLSRGATAIKRSGLVGGHQG